MSNAAAARRIAPPRGRHPGPRTLLFGVEAFDAGFYLGVSAVMVLVGLAASYLPTWRASKVDPMVSLRSE